MFCTSLYFIEIAIVPLNVEGAVTNLTKKGTWKEGSEQMCFPALK